MPDWFDAQKFNKAKIVYRDNFAGINFGHLCGLLLTLYFPKNVETLRSTGESRNKAAIFHRYLQTVRNVQKWYEGDVFDPNDDAYRSLSMVRSMHAKAAKIMSGLHDGVVYISQWDMALTQWAFIGPIVLFKSRVGLHHCEDDDYEALVHFWRTIGFLLGIENRFNLCHSDYSQTLAACEVMLQREYKVQVAAAHPICLDYGQQVVATIGEMFKIFTWNSMSTYVHELVDIPRPDPMGVLDLICYNQGRFVILVMLRSKSLKNVVNSMLRWMLDMAEKQDLKMLRGNISMKN